ncbi:MAG: aminotransferase class IV [Myxococcota bacterium]
MKRSWADINGHLSQAEAARISVFDRGFVFGDSVVESTRVQGSTPFELDAHIARLLRSATYIGLPSLGHHELRDRADRLIEHAGHREAVLRLFLTAGVELDGVPTREEIEPVSVLTLAEVDPLPPLAVRGVSAMMVSVRKPHRLALDPRAQTGSDLNSVLAAREARSLGFAEAIMLDDAGRVAGGATDAIFAWIHDCWYTPPAGTHTKVAPAVVLSVLEANDEPVVEHPMDVEDLENADELLLVGSVRELTPIVELNGVPVGTGRPGTATQRLGGWFADR